MIYTMFVNMQVPGHAIYMPCFGFKNNFNWLQTTSDMRHFGSGMSSKSVGDSWKYVKLVLLGSVCDESSSCEYVNM